MVLTGTGRAFCVGQDLKEHIEILHSESSDALFRTVDEHYNPIVTTLVGMEKPVIAAVNGVAAGAGASLAFACDLRIVADTAGFNLAFANVALSCDTGSSFTLQRLVGKAKAIELLYFPRTVKADEALALGLATRVVPAGELAEGDAAVAGVRRRARLRRVRRLRVDPDDPHRGDRRPRRRRRRVPGQGHACLPGPVGRHSGHFCCGTSAVWSPTATEQAPELRFVTIRWGLTGCELRLDKDALCGPRLATLATSVTRPLPFGPQPQPQHPQSCGS